MSTNSVFHTIIFLLLLAYIPAQASDLCSVPEIIKLNLETINPSKKPKKSWCQEGSTLFNDSSGLKEIKYAKILHEQGWDDDVFYSSFIYIIRLPDGKVVNLNKLSPTSSIPLEIYSELNYDLSYAGGLVRADENTFINKKYLSNETGTICLVFEMKYPFIGKFRNCGGNIEIVEKISNSPRSLSIEDAKKIVCAAVFNNLAIQCGNNQTEIIGYRASRDPNDSLNYTILSRTRIRSRPELKRTERTRSGWVTSVPVEYDVRTYQVNAIDGKLELIRHTPSSLCGTHDCNGN